MGDLLNLFLRFLRFHGLSVYIIGTTDLKWMLDIFLWVHDNMDWTLIFITLILGLIVIGMGSIGCYNKHGTVGSEQRYLVLLLILAVITTSFGLYRGLTRKIV